MKILVINPGGSSTKIAIFIIRKKPRMNTNRHEITRIINKEFEIVIRHPIEKLKRYKSVLDQLEYRKNLIVEAVGKRPFDAIVTRGGPLKPLKSGTYRITKKVVDDITKGRIQSMHPSLLGSLIAYKMMRGRTPQTAFFVDPESVDEFSSLARISGLPEIPRKSLSHFLNTNAVIRKAAKKLGTRVNQCNFIIAHLGSGITVAAKEKGKQIDANNANEDGPFSPQRSGSLPLAGVIDMCYSHKYNKQEMLDKIQRQGGLLAHLGTDDIKEIEKRIKNGDKRADLIYNAMIYQIAKEIGSMYVALKGKVTAIIITGGVACQKKLVNKLKSWIKFMRPAPPLSRKVNSKLASGNIKKGGVNIPILVFPGEEEMTALAEGAIRVLLKKEKLQIY